MCCPLAAFAFQSRNSTYCWRFAPAFRYCTALLLWLGSAAGWAAPPPNDRFPNASIIQTPSWESHWPLEADYALATLDAGEAENSAIAMGNGNGTVWWRWLATASGEVRVSAYNHEVEVLLAVFTGNSLADLQVVIPPDLGKVTCEFDECWHSGDLRFRATAGWEYYFCLMGYPKSHRAGGVYEGIFQFVPEDRPPNDDFANRQVLTGNRIEVRGSNFGATVELGEPLGGAALAISHSLWYTWRAPVNGAIRIRLESPVAVDALAYRGSSLGELERIGDSRWGPTLIEVRAGEDVQIAICGAPRWGCCGGPVGDFSFFAEFHLPEPTSPNDAFQNAIAIPETPFEFSGSLWGASREPQEPIGQYGDAGSETLWWSFTAPVSGTFTASVEAVEWEPRLIAYAGAVLPQLSHLKTVDGSVAELTVRIEPTRPYWLQLTRRFGTPPPLIPFVLRSRFAPEPSNDYFVNRELLEGTNLVIRSWFNAATIEPDEPLPRPDTRRTLWWSWEAPFDGRAVLTPRWVSVSDQYGVGHLTVLTGPVLSRLTEVLTLRDGPEAPLRFSAKGGTVYHIQGSPLSAELEPAGFELAIYPFEAGPNDHFAQALDLNASGGRSLVSNLGGTREIGEPEHGGVADGRSFWWKWRAGANGELAVFRLGWAGTLTNVTLAVYQGESLEMLTRIASGRGETRFTCRATESYYLAAETPEDEIGDFEVWCFEGPPSGVTHEVPGNLVRNPSFEGFDGTAFAHWRGELGGRINEVAPDGRNSAYVALGSCWQEIETTPGQEYRLRFVWQRDFDNAGTLEVLFAGQQVGRIAARNDLPTRWESAEFNVGGTSDRARLEFRGSGYPIFLDQVSLVAKNQPPAILREPDSLTAWAGSDVVLVAGVTGSEPVVRQWYFAGAPILGARASVLELRQLQPSHAGEYHLVASNAFGVAVTRPAVMTVEVPSTPQIVLQPQSDVASPGEYRALGVAAVGIPPLQYQWLRDGQALVGATQTSLVIPSFGPANVGTYTVTVANAGGATLSLPATLRLSESPPAELAPVIFANMGFPGWSAPSIMAPVFDLDGLTRLNGDRFLAQLYYGPRPEDLRPFGSPRTFLSGHWQGFWESAEVLVPDLPATGRAFAQVRVWDRTHGASYETARALGGRFGRSAVLELNRSDDGWDGRAYRLAGLASFSLRAGFPAFTTGRIELANSLPDTTLVWQLTGAAGFRYLVERQTDGRNWLPFVVLTNETGTVEFPDQTSPETTMQIYRARILD